MARRSVLLGLVLAEIRLITRRQFGSDFQAAGRVESYVDAVVARKTAENTAV